MPSWLKEVQGKIRQQLDRDRQLLDLARSSGDDPDAQDARQGHRCGSHDRTTSLDTLEIHLQAAIPTFLKARRCSGLILEAWPP